jgi:hypothetical protein
MPHLLLLGLALLVGSWTDQSVVSNLTGSSEGVLEDAASGSGSVSAGTNKGGRVIIWVDIWVVLGRRDVDVCGVGFVRHGGLGNIRRAKDARVGVEQAAVRARERESEREVSKPKLGRR